MSCNFYSHLFNTQNTIMSSKMHATYKKNIKKDSNQLDITFIHLPHRTSQLGCPRQTLWHLLLVEDQKACPPAPPQPRVIIHRHLRILLFYGTITIDSVPFHRWFFFLLFITLLFVQLNVTLIMILRHIYINKLAI